MEEVPSDYLAESSPPHLSNLPLLPMFFLHKGLWPWSLPSIAQLLLSYKLCEKICNLILCTSIVGIISLFVTSSLMMWKSTSKCLLCSWYTGLVAIWSAWVLLSSKPCPNYVGISYMNFVSPFWSILGKILRWVVQLQTSPHDSYTHPFSPTPCPWWAHQRA